MKKFRALLCILLAVAMVLSFAACGKKTDDNVPADDAADNKPADDSKPADDGGEDAPPADDGGDDTADYPPEMLPDPDVQPNSLLMMSSVDEYLNRPHEIQAGTSLTFHTNDVPAQTPWNATAEVWLLPNIYEGLLFSYMGKSDDIRPLIAESYTYSDDYLTWVFQIREGIKFTDGNPVDAAAICKAWDFYYEVSPASFNNVNLVKWEATGDMEVTATLSAPCSYFENTLTRLYILSPTAMEEFGPNDNRAAIGTAPYYITDYVAGVGFEFKANPDYYFYDRMPVIETIKYQIISDENTKLMAMLNGDLDGYTFTSIESYYNLQDYAFDGILLESYGNCDPLFLNAKSVPEFQIFEVRKAINRFLDLEALNEILYDGKGLVQQSLWSVDSSGEVPWPEGFYYDEAEGLELMAAGGVDPNELHFAAKIIDTGADFFVTIQGQLAKVGITMEVEPLEPEANFTFLKNGDYTITAGNSGYADSSPYGPWTFILLPEHLIKEVWTDIYDPELYEEMCDTYYAMTSAPMWDEMLEHCHHLTDLLQRDYGAMPGLQKPYYAAFRKDIKNIILITENHSLLWFYLYL